MSCTDMRVTNRPILILLLEIKKFACGGQIKYLDLSKHSYSDGGVFEFNSSRSALTLALGKCSNVTPEGCKQSLLASFA